MARYWPHESRIQVQDRHKLRDIISWMHDQFGDANYQHWSSEYVYPWLTIKFCDHNIKTQFDLSWS
jgi:hypothetical protein